MSIDCDVHKDLCGRYEIKGFPTIKVLGSDKAVAPTDYSQRDSASMVNHVIGLLPNFIIKVPSTSLDGFLAKKGVKLVLLHCKTDTPPMFKSLAVEFDGSTK